MTNIKTVVIFGGAGFIGCHFTEFLLENNLATKIIIADINDLDVERTTKNYSILVEKGLIEFIYSDVRNPIELAELKNINLIANFAAIHREPGHAPFEYFETNLKGAENVCNWADKIDCKNIIFTSSIAPYGPSEQELTEKTTPVPISAYGSSKLTAEKIHTCWQRESIIDRKLVIIRPGVVFGAGEGGNVSRLIKATLNRYFFYMGNRETRKAGIYVKELCNAIFWVMEHKTKNGFALFNMTMDPGPTISEYVDSVCTVAKVERYVPNVPSSLLYVMSFVIEPLAKLFNIQQPISPVRIKKLVRSNNILPKFLVENGYEYKYKLTEAMKDWKEDKPSEW